MSSVACAPSSNTAISASVMQHRGRFAAHAIRAAAGTAFARQPHLHRTEFQLVYVLEGWIEFEYEGQGRVRLEAGGLPVMIGGEFRREN